MHGPFVDWLSSWGPVGIVILILIFVIPLIIKAVSQVLKWRDIYKAHVTSELQKAQSFDKVTENVDELITSIDGLKTDIDRMDQRLENHKRGISDLYKKIDQSIEESVKGDAKLHEEMNSFGDSIKELSSKISSQQEMTKLLLDSDKETIKATITNIYYESKKQGFIEPYKLQAIEPMYEKYLQENGDTFVASIMNQLRLMPNEEVKR